MKAPLMERINNPEKFSTNTDKEKHQDISIMIFEIKNDIENLKKDITLSQQIETESKKIQQIEDDIQSFYLQMQTPDTQEETNKENIEDIYKEAIKQKETYSNIDHQKTELQKHQAKIMNENIHKFIFVYQEKNKLLEEKDKAITEKNTSIYVLQKKLTEAEQKLKLLSIEEKNIQEKDNTIAAKSKIIQLLEQKLDEVAEKYTKVLSLYKEQREKEQNIYEKIQQKNEYITTLHDKIREIEAKFEKLTTTKEESKEKFLHKKLWDIDKKITKEKRKNRIYIFLYICILGLGIAWSIFLYSQYIPKLIHII